MSEQELIAAVKAAKTKDELEALVLKELGVDLDKRRGFETLRKEILTGLGVGPDGQRTEQEADRRAKEDLGDQQPEEKAPGEQEQQGGAGQDEPQQPAEPSGLGSAQQQDAAEQLPAEPLASTGLDLASEPEPELPGLDDEEEDRQDEEPAPANRLLRNRENGREFVWTPDLAKLSHMEEV